eukprot:scaffold180605_cov22-Tisochrysis_lutea.AAC.3
MLEGGAVAGGEASLDPLCDMLLAEVGVPDTVGEVFLTEAFSCGCMCTVPCRCCLGVWASPWGPPEPGELLTAGDDAAAAAAAVAGSAPGRRSAGGSSGGCDASLAGLAVSTSDGMPREVLL